MFYNNKRNTFPNPFQSKFNAPSFAYYTAYDEKVFIPGREAQHETYKLLNIDIDKHIPKKAMLKLMLLPDIESRASCEGEDKRHITFFIFRPIDQREEIVKLIVRKLIRLGYKSKSNIGQNNKYRICVTDILWYSKENKDKFNKWWNKLSDDLYNIFDEIYGKNNIPLFHLINKKYFNNIDKIYPPKLLLKYYPDIFKEKIYKIYKDRVKEYLKLNREPTNKEIIYFLNKARKGLSSKSLFFNLQNVFRNRNLISNIDQSNIVPVVIYFNDINFLGDKNKVAYLEGSKISIKSIKEFFNRKKLIPIYYKILTNKRGKYLFSNIPHIAIEGYIDKKNLIYI